MDKYKTYSQYDFLRDKDFIQWVLFPSDSTNAHWTAVAGSDPELAATIEKARTLFSRNVKLNDYKESDDIIDVLYSSLIGRIRSRKKRARILRLSLLSGAACIILALFGILRFYGYQEADLTASGDHAAGMLFNQSSDINEVTLVSGDSIAFFSNNSEIVYADATEAAGSDPDKQDVVYNQLIVPYGRRSSIVLADGTKIWINAGSIVTFPVSFPKNERRIIVEGEVYLDVAKDKAKPFYIECDGMEVRVLGTQFGITAYANERSGSVVLVNGAVEVKCGNSVPHRLRPNQRLIVENESVSVQTVDVMDYVSWKNGWLRISSCSLEELLQKLSKYYNRNITCEESLKSLRCHGKLVLAEDYNATLRTISYSLNIKYDQDKLLLHN